MNREGGRYFIDQDILDRGDAAVVCSVVLDVLGPDVTAAQIDAYTDGGSEMPEEIRVVQEDLRRIGVGQRRGDPCMGIELDLHNPVHARLLQLFAPWSINVDLYGPAELDIATFHDCGMSVHFRASPEQAAHVAVRLTALGITVISEADINERRRQRRRTRWARRRDAFRARVRPRGASATDEATRRP